MLMTEEEALLKQQEVDVEEEDDDVGKLRGNELAALQSPRLNKLDVLPTKECFHPIIDQTL